MNTILPFSALVGLDAARQALLLLAVEPRLRGLVLAASAGSGKSSLARGFRALLERLAETPQAAPFVELPINSDEAGLLGGLDIQATLQAGRRVARPGALARAHGGVVYVDGLNLLPDSSANMLLSVIESGEVRVEREGLSLRAPAHFRFIGTYDPAEGNPRRHLLDRVGLLITLPPAAEAEQRAEVVRRNVRPAWAEWEEDLALMAEIVREARALLPSIPIDDRQVEFLAAAADAFGAEGHRADMFATYAARASAALSLRDEVEPADLELAVRLVILPRATRMPPAPAEPPPPEQPQQNQQQEQSDVEPPEEETQNSELNTQNFPEEQVLSALAAELPEDLAELPFRVVRRGRSGSRGATAGQRGRHVRSLPGDPRRARIDIAATLRAAAPWQRLRAENQEPRAKNRSDNTGSRFSVLGSERPSVSLHADDLRVKQFQSKAGALFCFAVDASGSMALHRMRQAKGAVHTLLQRAYVQRDRVALLAFRGDRSDVLLPPSQSVELARRALDLLPTGGGTPLAAALLQALDVAKQARSRGIFQTVLVLLTDGRANVGLRAERAEIGGELQLLARNVAAAGIQSIVIDTQRSYLSRGEAQKLAGWLSGTYVYLPNAKGEQIADLAQSVRAEI